jgi:hypothetical protein
MHLLPLADCGVKGAEAEVAVGLQRAHTEFLGQGESLPVVDFGRCDIGRITMPGNLTEQLQGTRLPAAS